MKEVKLKDGKKVKLKDLSLDECNDLLDSKEDNIVDGKLKMLHSTLTKYLRVGIDGDTSDETIKKMSYDDRVEIFKAIERNMLLGEESPSS